MDMFRCAATVVRRYMTLSRLSEDSMLNSSIKMVSASTKQGEE